MERELFGSEDGEAVFVRKGDEGRWIMLGHMDPSFNEMDFEADIDDILRDLVIPIENQE